MEPHAKKKCFSRESQDISGCTQEQRRWYKSLARSWLIASVNFRYTLARLTCKDWNPAKVLGSSQGWASGIYCLYIPRLLSEYFELLLTRKPGYMASQMIWVRTLPKVDIQLVTQVSRLLHMASIPWVPEDCNAGTSLSDDYSLRGVKKTLHGKQAWGGEEWGCNKGDFAAVLPEMFNLTL
jgi:hypothetical protein